jgi:hypothetical protein
MTLTLLVIAVAIICAIVVTWAKRSKDQSELDRHSISVLSQNTYERLKGMGRGRLSRFAPFGDGINLDQD